MKLKFTIQYGTQWGESMHVVLCCGSQDGTLRTSNLLMTTQDGLWWKLETAVLESRQHPVSTITYYYQVEDAEGTVLRKEWSQVSRKIRSFRAEKIHISCGCAVGRNRYHIFRIISYKIRKIKSKGLNA